MSKEKWIALKRPTEINRAFARMPTPQSAGGQTNQRAIILKNIDKLAVFAYFLDTYPLFYIPHPIISDFEIRVSNFRFIRYGGETASTGIKKLELHTERPVSS